MIKSFKHKGLEDLFYNGTKKGIRPEHADKIARILDRLNSASDIIDMNYPGSHLHKLTGNLKDQYSVRVSGNWRIFFEFKDGDAYIVNYSDYHKTRCILC
jgi:proteic killer suppression protein